MLKDRDRKELSKVFEKLQHPVNLIMFTQEIECEYCQVTREIVEEVAGLTSEISAEVKDFVKDAEAAEALGVDKIPAIAVMGDKDYGIRYYGVPAGYEFTALIESIVDVSKHEHGLPDAVVAELAKVDRTVRLEVLVSPT